jgi:omega-6 fatty acid desaturase (delta-12 desaturase)
LSVLDRIREQKRDIIRRHSRSDNLKGLGQVASTLLPLGLLWWAAVLSVPVSLLLTAGLILLISLFNLRVFALLHECGHGSLCRSRWLNRSVGFVFGVVSGMPQYVWAQHHDYHHRTNGNWDKYRGALTTLAVEEYAALGAAQQKMYRRMRNIAMAPLAGFVYLIFNPRFTWLKGSLEFLAHVVSAKLAQPRVALRVHARSFTTRYWQSAREYRHMFWNNVVLLSVWGLMCWLIDPAHFFFIYLVSVSLAGGAGIVLFTVQHNFEHSYAVGSEGWDIDAGALAGTSFLILPRWLNWFTANIGYHHVHHISAAIPNYCLVKCHQENEQLFTSVTRIRLSQIQAALKCILWDRRAQRIISIAEYQRQSERSPA